MTNSPCSRRPSWQIIIAWLVGLPLLYIAGFGPLARLAQDGYLSEGPFQFLYTPLGMIISNSPPGIAHPFIYYLVLCGVRMG